MIDLRHLVCWTGRDAYLLVRNDADLRDDLLAIEHNRDGALDLIMYVVDALQVRRITYLVPRRKKSLESWSKAKASARYSSKLMVVQHLSLSLIVWDQATIYQVYVYHLEELVSYNLLQYRPQLSISLTDSQFPTKNIQNGRRSQPTDQ